MAKKSDKRDDDDDLIKVPKKKGRKSKNWLNLSDKEMLIIKAHREGHEIDPDIEKFLDQDIKNRKLASDKRDINTKYKHLQQELDIANARNEVIDALASIEDKPISYAHKRKVKDSTVSESVAILLASDWHIEERVEGSTVNFMNEYSVEISKERAQRFFERALYLIDVVRHSTTIDTIVLALLGDFITGYIHEELEENNEESPIEALMTVQGMIVEGIQFLLDSADIKELIIPCSIGNHGRTQKKKRVATAYKNSYEWLMYHQLQTMFAADERVTFVIGNSYHEVITLFDGDGPGGNGYKIRFHHGDYIRYGGGVGGITIPVNKAIAQWNKGYVKAYLDCFGHFHQAMDGGTFVANGSLIGWNSYAVSIKAEFDVPKQQLIFIERDHGKTCVWPILVSDK
jgi:hypothetical protein